MSQFYLSFFNLNHFYLNLVKRKWHSNGCHGSVQALDKAGFICKQYGFSLLELMVVVALLSIVALASTSLIIDNGDLKRQDATEKRWDQLHDAIISQPNLYLNGSPYVRGYVADMGRLPVSILELISQDDLATYDEDNNAATAEITIDQPDWQTVDLGYTAAAGFTSTINGGWRGPYLYTAGSRQFRDGWGAEDPDPDQDAFNFGWVIETDDDTLNPVNQPITEVTNLIVRSLGSDQDPSGSGDFTEDFPAEDTQTIISENEWTLSDAPITFNINFSQAAPSAQTDLELRLYRYVDNGDNVADITDLLIIPANASFDLAVAAAAAPAQTVTPLISDIDVGGVFAGTPIGRFAALIWCTTGASAPVVYDGDCNATVNHSPVYFTLTNNTSQVTLTWNVQ